MGLLKCPDCGKKVSDRLDACPKCGCPFSKEIKDSAAVYEQSFNEQKKQHTTQTSAKKKTLIIALIIILVAAAIATTLYFVLNLKNLQIKKAQEFITNGDYSSAVVKLERYKDDDDVKELYDNAVFMTTDEGCFLADLATGLMQRWDITNTGNDTDTYKRGVEAELNNLEKYKNTTFTDTVFNEKAHAYLESLDLQLSSLDYVNINYSKYSSDWEKGYEQRTVLISYFINNYNVPIDEKYAKIKSEFLSSASAISAQTEFDNLIYAMSHESVFEKFKDEYSWKHYRIQIENKTDKTFSSFQLVVDILDADGNIIEQTYTNSISSFAPGKKAMFEFSTDKTPASLSWNAEYYLP